MIRTPRGYAIVSALSEALRKNVTDTIFIDVNGAMTESRKPY